jgi:NADH dehydrogenase (ubiquinone) 1 alpha subcomplex subunit 13
MIPSKIISDCRLILIATSFLFIEQVDITRVTRARGLTGFQIWGLVSVGVFYGYYRVGCRNNELAAERLAERKERYAMAPILQAEQDSWYAERNKIIAEREAEVMKSVEGFTPGQSTYSTERWVPYPFHPLSRYFK